MPTPAPSTVCPKCSGTMELGLLVDATDHPVGTLVKGPERPLQWVRGAPRRSWWDQSFRTAPEDRLHVATLRCTACGFVELYAPQPE